MDNMRSIDSEDQLIKASLKVLTDDGEDKEGMEHDVWSCFRMASSLKKSSQVRIKMWLTNKCTTLVSNATTENIVSYVLLQDPVTGLSASNKLSPPEFSKKGTP